VVTFSTKAVMAFLAGFPFHEGSGSARAVAARIGMRSRDFMKRQAVVHERPAMRFR